MRDSTKLARLECHPFIGLFRRIKEMQALESDRNVAHLVWLTKSLGER